MMKPTREVSELLDRIVESSPAAIADLRDALHEIQGRLADQKQALELALSGAPLSEVLGVLVRAGQRQFGGDARTGIFLVGPEGTNLRFAASADLSERYAAAVDGFPIDPHYPACGRAAFTGEPELTSDVDADPLWDRYRDLAHEHGIRACWSFPLHAGDGRVLGTYAVYHRSPREPEARDLERVALLLQTAAIVIERHQESEARARTEASLRENQRQLAVELAAAQHLQQTSTQLIRLDNVDALYEQILDAAVAIMHADFASIQMLHPERGELHLLGHRGFTPQAARAWEWVRPSAQTVCGIALERKGRSVIPDVETCAAMAGGDAIESYRQAGIRAMQSTPLFSRSGQILGMLSTHWNQPHEPSGRDLALLDVLARQAADLIERTHAEAALRESEADARFRAALGERIRIAREPEALLDEVSRAIGDYLDVRRTFFVEIDEASDRGVIRRDYCRGVPSVAGEYRVSGYSPATRAEIAAGSTVVNCDSQQDPRTAAQYEECYSVSGERAYVAVPLMREGRWSGTFWVSTDEPRRWQPREVALLEAVAERSWNAAERLRLDAEVRVSEERYRSLTRILTSVVWHTDAAGRFTAEQPEWAAFTGQTWDEYRGDGWASALHPDDRERVCDLWRRALEARTAYESTGRLWHAATGEYRYFVARAVPLLESGGTIREWIGTITDVHEQKKAEEALRETDRRKDEFLATLSHELRTPLTSGYGWVKLLAQAPDMLEVGLEQIDSSFVSQIRLVDDLLDVSRIIAGKLNLDLQPVDLSGIVGSAVEMLRPSAEGKSVDLRVHIRSVPVVLGDAMRLQQVVWNLLSNAIKFTPPGGQVEIDLRQAGANAQIVVRDTGDGIDAKFLPHVFARFRQADGTINRRHGGLGLGLSIVASLVEAHSGLVRAESAGPDQGSVFTVTIPLIAQSELVAPSRLHSHRAPEEQHLGGVRVLVVDDDAGARQLMSKALEAFGADVHECSGARQAYEVLSHWRPDIIVSDLAMPDEDGYSLIRHVRESGNIVPAVAVTAYARSDDETRVREAGFQRHVSKPFDPQLLIDAVHELARA